MTGDPLISIIVPTIDGRERWLDRCLRSYAGTTTVPYETIVVKNKPTCGIAWNEGLAQAKGAYLHLTADDIEALPGWAETGIAWVDRGILPAARVLNSDGTVQSCGDDVHERDTGTPTMLVRVPFFNRAVMEIVTPIIETHYRTDAWITNRARLAGWPSQVVRDFCFIHHYAPEGRLDHRAADDRAVFDQAIRRPL